MGMCKKCGMVSGGLFLIAGLLLLLADLGMWDWGVSWWTAAFLIMGLTGCAKTKCKDCK